MSYDLKIINARIIDGSGAPSYPGSLAMQDGRIAALGDVPGDANRVIDVGGAVVAPGFVDTCRESRFPTAIGDIFTPVCAHGFIGFILAN